MKKKELKQILERLPREIRKTIDKNGVQHLDNTVDELPF